MCIICDVLNGYDMLDRARIEDAARLVFNGVAALDVERAGGSKRKLNPLKNRDLVAIELDLVDGLRRAGNREGKHAMELLAKLLGPDFDVTDAYARYMVEELALAYPVFGAAIAESAIPISEKTAQKIIKLTREHLAGMPRFADAGLDLTEAFTVMDARAVDAIGRKPAMWIGDYYVGPKIDQAREIISSGMKLGLDRNQIAEFLKEALGRSFQDYRYWDVVASSVTTRARTWSVLTSMQEAGFDRYRIQAVWDERTCNICLMMDGREFDVAKSVSRIESTFGMETPDELKYATPWLAWDSKRKDAYYMKGERAVYVGDRGSESLQNSGIGMPPFHGNCRCTMVLAD